MLSILDRLIDFDPGSSQEMAKSSTQSMEEFLQSICRDLEDLLNTRARCLPWPSTYKYLENSIINFGFDDTLTYNLKSEKAQTLFCQNIEQAIKRYEKRFKTVKVSLQNQNANNDLITHRLFLNIEATLVIDPHELLVLDSEFHFDSCSFVIKNR